MTDLIRWLYYTKKFTVAEILEALPVTLTEIHRALDKY